MVEEKKVKKRCIYKKTEEKVGRKEDKQGGSEEENFTMIKTMSYYDNDDYA